MKLAFYRIRLALAASFVAAVGILCPGCQSVTGSTAKTLVRVIDASYNAPAVDIHVGATVIASNVGAPNITDYAFLPPAALPVTVFPVNAKTATVQTSGTFLASQQHSVYITDFNSTYQATVLTDQNTPAPSGDISVRFLQQAPLSGNVDIYFVPDGSKFSDSKAILSGLAPGTTTAYLNIPAGTFSVVVVPSGATAAKYTSQSIVFTGGQVRTMLIVDQQLLTNPPINVVIGNDLN
jgi:hypothetical protein